MTYKSLYYKGMFLVNCKEESINHFISNELDKVIKERGLDRELIRIVATTFNHPVIYGVATTEMLNKGVRFYNELKDVISSDKITALKDYPFDENLFKAHSPLDRLDLVGILMSYAIVYQGLLEDTSYNVPNERDIFLKDAIDASILKAHFVKVMPELSEPKLNAF